MFIVCQFDKTKKLTKNILAVELLLCIVAMLPQFLGWFKFLIFLGLPLYSVVKRVK